jgi:ADP-ribose pyrophosphatase YjhB (NUDIX family)
MSDAPTDTMSAGGVVINPKGEVLVVNQNGNSWSLPKGQIDEGETALRAARREIFEESGVTELNLIKELGTYTRYRIGKGGMGENTSEMKTIIMFLFHTTQMKLDPVDVANPEACWVEKDKVSEMLTHPKDKEFFETVEKEL